MTQDRLLGPDTKTPATDLGSQCAGWRLTTAEITYHMPDYPTMLQIFVWQNLDLPPRFPGLLRFLEFWKYNIDGPLHSVRVGHIEILSPSKWRQLESAAIIH